MTDALNCDGFNIVQNNGECAGQTVFHFHMHLIPRYKGDQVLESPGKPENSVMQVKKKSYAYGVLHDWSAGR